MTQRNNKLVTEPKMGAHIKMSEQLKVSGRGREREREGEYVLEFSKPAHTSPLSSLPPNNATILAEITTLAH